MRAPQLVILEADGWLARQFRELAADSEWLVREPRKHADALALVRDRRPTVLVVQVEPADDTAAAVGFVAEVHRVRPDVPTVAVSDVKLSDADRAAWTALLTDVGARYVLFPPLSKPVLEDVVSGLMAAGRRGGPADEPES